MIRSTRPVTRGGVARRTLRAGGLALSLLPSLLLAAEPATPPATAIADVRARLAAADGSGPLVRLRATVTALSPQARGAYVDDGSGGILVLVPAGSGVPQPGWRLEVQGRATWRGSELAVSAETIHPLGIGPLPAAAQASVDAIFDGRHEARRVEVEGIVREVVSRDGDARLALGVGHERLRVSVPGVGAAPAARLLDARLRVRAVATQRATHDGGRGLPLLLAASADDLRVIEPGAPDSFVAPLLRAAALDRLDAHPGSDRRVRVRGVVSRHRLGHGLYLIDGGQPLYVETRQGPQLEPGDEVEVAGFPGADARATLLEGAVWRRLGRRAPPGPRPVTASEILSGKHEAALVRVEGRLLSLGREPNNTVLVLTGGGAFFYAVVDADAGGEELARIAPGSTLALTGVVYQRRGGSGGSFDLLMRSGRDVSVLSGPGWTAAHGVALLAGASLLALAAFAWVVALRRQVAQKARLVNVVAAEKEQRLTQIIDSLAEGLLALDADRRVMLWNAAATRLCGRTAAEALGRPLAEAWPQIDTPALRAALDDARLGIGGAPFDLEGACPDEPGAVLEARVFAFAGGSTVLLDDVTAARALMGELRRARAAAEGAAQAKAEFLANMSHEIRTPLNAVIGLTGPLLDTPLDAEQRDLVATIRSSADTLLALVSGILDFSKIDAGKLELEAAPFVLRACVEDALRLVADRAARQGLALGCEFEPGVPPVVVGDLTRLRQVLVNLADNAVKFTLQGEVVVRVRAALPGRPELRFEVADTGPGIPEHARARLFQAFAQLDASTTRRFGGTGLGLALCQRLVERMGGRIAVDSAVGAGTTFTFDLPLRAASGPAPEPYAPAPGLLGGRRVLVLARGEGTRRGLVSDLRAWGLQVRDTGEVAQALGWIQEGAAFDAALVDLDLDPSRVQATLAARRVPVISWSWAAVPAAPDLGQLALRKPVRLGRLLAALRAALDLPAVAQRLETASGAQRLADLVPLRILVVEDNAVNQKVALLTLRSLGYEADLAADGHEALRAVRRQPYDVVLMDVQMPEMDGLEATRRIRAEHPEGGPRIVALSASTFAEDRERARAAGMDGFVAKPMDVADLRRVLLAQAYAGPPVDAEGGAPPPVEPSEPALDGAVVDTLRLLMSDDGEDGFGELCAQFVENTTLRLGRLARAAEGGEVALVVQEAHTLVGSSATFGAKPLARLLGEIESLGRAQRLDGVPALVAEAETEFARVRAALARLRATSALVEARASGDQRDAPAHGPGAA